MTTRLAPWSAKPMHFSLWRTLLLAAVAVILGFAPGAAGSIDADLAATLARIDGDEFVRVMVRMEDQPFVSRAMGPELAKFVLQTAADRAQAPLVQQLGSLQRTGDVRAYTPFWIVNVVFVEVRADKVARLASLPGVAYVYEDVEFTLPDTEMTPADVGADLLRWDHVAAVLAPELWELGFRGQGVTVAVVDTGVDISHPDLAGAMGGEAPYYEGYWAEFDANGRMVPGSRPYDSATHGTHVSGTVAGRNTTHQIGVAPEVTLAHGLVLKGTTGTFPQVLAGLQWVADQGFDIINGSLGSNTIVPDMAVATDNLVAAGVVPIFANGNIRIDSVPPGAPGNTPAAIAIGAYDANGREASFNRGDIIEYPGYDYDEFTRIKPDISAPGVDVLSTYPGGGWAYGNGTSMSSPHAAGVAALLLSAYPDLTVEEMKQVLYASTGGHKERFGWDDIPTKDIHFGWGRINALQAFQLAGGPGSVPVAVSGTVTGDGEPVAGATVTFRGFSSAEFTTDEAGRYAGELNQGVYTVMAGAPGHEPDTRTINLIGVTEPVQVDFDLVRIHTGTLAGTVTSVASWPGESTPDEEQLPVAGVVVRIPELGRETVTDRDGRYTLEFVRVGQWTVHFEHRDYTSRQARADIVRDETTVLDAELVPAGGVVSYRNSFDSTGQQRHWSRFDDTGAGGWRFVEDRAYSEPFSAGHGLEGDGATGYGPNQRARMISPYFTVFPGGQQFSFRLWADLWGPFHRLRVYIHDEAAGERRLLYTFDDPEAPEGWMLVGFNLQDYVDRTVALEFEVQTDDLVRPENAGVFIDDVAVRARDSGRPSTLVGRVLEGSSRGIPGALITAVEQQVAGEPRIVQTTSGTGGQFELALPGGRWTVRVTKTGDYVPVERHVYIDHGDRNTVHFNMTANPGPAALTGLHAAGQDESVRLTWDPVSGGDTAGYNVYVSTEDGRFARRGYTTETGFVVDGLADGKTYRFRVAAMDVFGKEGEAGETTGGPKAEGPTVQRFDVKPRTVLRGGPVQVTAELGHATDSGATLHVRLRATTAGETVREWEFAHRPLGEFAAEVVTADASGEAWAPDVYRFTLFVTDGDGNEAVSNTILVALTPPLPRALSFLLGNNPFNPNVESQRLEYTLPAAGRVEVAVYALDGRRLRTLAEGRRDAGRFIVFWDGADASGRGVLGGMYVVRLWFTDDDGHAVELTRHSVVVK